SGRDGEEPWVASRGRSFSAHLDQARRQPWPGPGLLVLEEHERFGPLPVPDTIGPIAQVRLAVRDAAEPQVPKARRRHERRIPGLPRVGDAPGGATLPQRVVDLVVVPGGVAELERRARPGREQGQERAEPRNVLGHGRRELEQDGPESWAQRRGGPEQ